LFSPLSLSEYVSSFDLINASMDYASLFLI
jgi:hypothetical protein